LDRNTEQYNWDQKAFCKTIFAETWKFDAARNDVKRMGNSIAAGNFTSPGMGDWEAHVGLGAN